MLRRMNEMVKVPIRTTDGHQGRARDVLFDDASFTVRYLVADTRRWLAGRRVLLSPASFRPPVWVSGEFRVNLSKEDIEAGPSIEEDRPVSRRQEAELADYYRWPPYWVRDAVDPSENEKGDYPESAAMRDAYARRETAPERESGDPHLRSASEVAGYRLACRNGAIGRLADFLVDEKNWTIPFAIVDTGEVADGKAVLVPVNRLMTFDWEKKEVRVDLPIDAIRRSPVYEPGRSADAQASHRFRPHA